MGYAPELVAPARPTPHGGAKTLSDIDDFSECRYYASAIDFFSRDPTATADNVHPARSIVAALAEALVYYYPIAGCLREIPGGKLVVDCTGEGVVFVEADADVSLEELGGQPPYPCAEEFVWDDVVERGSGAVVVVGRPLFYMQVTRLKDGAFVLGFQVCHVIGDAAGVTQFIRAIAELARGEAHPSVSPVWERGIFKARDPPRVRHDVYPAYDPTSPSRTVLGDHDDVDDPMLSTPTEELVGQYLRFGRKEVVALRRHLDTAQPCTTFELLTAFLWKCRTAALGYRPWQRVRLVLRVDVRGNSTLVEKGPFVPVRKVYLFRLWNRD